MGLSKDFPMANFKGILFWELHALAHPRITQMFESRYLHMKLNTLDVTARGCLFVLANWTFWGDILYVYWWVDETRCAYESSWMTCVYVTFLHLASAQPLLLYSSLLENYPVGDLDLDLKRVPSCPCVIFQLGLFVSLSLKMQKEPGWARLKSTSIAAGF